MSAAANYRWLSPDRRQIDGTRMARILVIDDDHAVRLTIQVILERDGHEVICAADGERGLRAFQSAAPQLIITDIIMPNKEGLETIMEIRARDAAIPIIAMSGGGRVGNADFLKMALRVGASAILPKPFERQDLSAAVSRALTI
jgi:CheY-like chemotaxis protein